MGRDMRRISFYADRNRSSNLLHVEADGCIVNIRVGLHDDKGRRVTAISVIPDNDRFCAYTPDGQPVTWEARSGDCSVRVVQVPKEAA